MPQPKSSDEQPKLSDEEAAQQQRALSQIAAVGDHMRAKRDALDTMTIEERVELLEVAVGLRPPPSN